MTVHATSQPLPAPADREPILSQAEAARRMLLLTDLKAALAHLGVSSVLARNQRLVLRYNQVPQEPSGLTDPRLHILTPAGTAGVTADGDRYRLDSGEDMPASDPASAARRIASLSTATAASA